MASSEPSYRYPGSRPFQDTPLDRKLFWGRGEEAHELLHLTLAERLVVVFAASGLGKSSLINAGLLEPLRQRDFFPITARVNDLDRGPLPSVYRDIEEAMRREGLEILTVPEGRLEREYGLVCRGGEFPAGEISDHCVRRRIPLWLFFKEIEFWRGDVLLEPLLILDQFEELFVQPLEMRAEFIDELACLVRDRLPHEVATTLGGSRASGEHAASEDDLSGPKVKVLLALREDWLGALEELKPKIPGILNTRFRLAPLRREQAREAIEKPAGLATGKVGGQTFSYSPEAVEAILDFLARHRRGGEMVSSDEVAPSQLQLICQHLEGLASADGHPPLITLDDLGGRRERSAAVLERVLEDFYSGKTTGAVKGFRRRAVQRLCEEGLIVAGRRVSSDGSVLKQRFGVSDDDLRHLVDCHLLRAIPRLDSVYYELGHDTLVDPVLNARRRRRRRWRRVLGWGVAALLFLTLFFGYERLLAHLALENRATILTDLQRHDTGLSPSSSAAYVLARADEAGCLDSPDDALCAEVLGLLAVAVDAGREIGRPGKEVPIRTGAMPYRARVRLSESGDRIAEANANRVRVRDSVGGFEQVIPAPLTPLTAMAVAPDGRTLASAGKDGSLRLWRYQIGASGGLVLEPRTAPWPTENGDPLALAFAPDGKRLLSSGQKGGLRLWDLQPVEHGQPERDPVLTEPLEEVKINAIAWSSDGERLAIGGKDGLVRVWNGERWHLHEGHAKGVRAVAFDPAGELLASASDDGSLRLWPLDGRSMRWKYLTDEEDDELKTLAWSGDGRTLVSGGTGRRVFLLPVDREIARAAAARESPLGRPVVLGRHEGHVLSVAWFGEDLVASGGRDGRVRLWSAARRQEIASLDGYERYVTTVVFTPDGKLVSASYSGSLKALDVAGGGPVAGLDQEVDQVISQHDLTAVALSADGRLLASGSSDSTLRLRRWDAGEQTFRRLMAPTRGPWGRIEALAFDPSGERLASLSADRRFRLWSLDGEILDDFPSGVEPEEDVKALAFSSDGETLILHPSTGPPRFWDVAVSASPSRDELLANPAQLVETACRRLRSLPDESSLIDTVAALCADS